MHPEITGILMRPVPSLCESCNQDFTISEVSPNCGSSAPPDRGLATKQMSGKKKDKFRITLGFACNADGSKKLPAFYIGKSKQPCCFKKKTPQSRGFYYRNNKKAWMTAELFEE